MRSCFFQNFIPNNIRKYLKIEPSVFSNFLKYYKGDFQRNSIIHTSKYFLYFLSRGIKKILKNLFVGYLFFKRSNWIEEWNDDSDINLSFRITSVLVRWSPSEQRSREAIKYNKFTKHRKRFKGFLIDIIFS